MVKLNNSLIMDKDLFKDAFSELKSNATPSSDFTANVMSRIETVKEAPFEYKPLIARKWLYMIIAAYSTICLIPIISGSTETVSLLFEQLSKFGIDAKQAKQSSQAIFIMAILCSTFVYLDVFFQKRRLNGISF